MSIPMPTDLPLLGAQQLAGQIPFAEEPLATLLKRANWIYKTYSPAALNLACWSDTSSNSLVYTVPFQPSADGLSYQPSIALVTDTTGDVNVTVETSPDASTWSSVSGWSTRALACTAVDVGLFLAEDPISVPASAAYLKITVAHSLSSPAYVQLHGFMLHVEALPSPTTLSAGEKACGFAAYEDAHLTGTGAGLHTEYLNRIAQNVSALAADRVHCIAGFAQDSGGQLRLDPTNGSRRQVLRGRVHLPANVAGTVKIWTKFSGAGSEMRVGQLNGAGEFHKFTAGSFHQTAEITVTGQYPTLFAEIDIGSTAIIDYLIMTYTPQTGADYAPTGSGYLINEVDPPPFMHLLGAAEDLTMRLAIGSYATCAHVFDLGNVIPSDYPAAGTIFNTEDVYYTFQRVPPGAYAYRANFVNASDGGSAFGSLTDVEAASKTGSGGTNMEATVPPDIQGIGHLFLMDGGVSDVAITDAGGAYISSGDGDGPFRVDKDDEGQVQIIAQKNCTGSGGEWYIVNDLTTL